MTAESETSREPRPTRRGVLLGIGLAGLGGTVAGCSTAAVPYSANEAGQVPGSAPTSPAMAMPAGTVLSAASEIPVGGGKIFTAEKVVVTQPARGQYRAFSAVCTHVGCILDKVANGVIGCPCHGGEFTITTGTVVAGPPPTPLPRKRVKIVDGKVVLLLRRGWQDGGVGSLMLLDTASLYFRAFYGVPDTVKAPDGTPVNAVRGLLDMIARLVRARQPSRLIACWDADWRPAFRVAAIPSYKAHRLAEYGKEATPPGLDAQVPVIEDVLTAAGVVIAGAPGFEADDVIGTLAARSAEPVDVVSGDRDLFQVIDDARGVRVIYTVRGLMNMDVIDEAAVTAKYGIPGRGYADFAALRGDPSDGLPGVPGVGEKTAATLVKTFGSIDGIIAALDAGHGGFPRGARDKLEKARDYLRVAMSVVRVREDVPLPPVEGNLPAVPPDAVRLKDLGERWGLGSSLSRFLSAVGSNS